MYSSISEGKEGGPEGVQQQNIVEVVCPAIEAEERYYDEVREWSDDIRPPELVVQGKMTKTTEYNKTGEDRVLQVKVEKVLYGSLSNQTLTFNYHFNVPKEKRIFVLVPKEYHEDRGMFDLKWAYDNSEEKAVKTLFDAWLDYNTLAAKFIFIGKEISYKKDYLGEIGVNLREVEVIRTLAGTEPKKGTKVNVLIPDRNPTIRSDPEFYFISGVLRKKGKPVRYFLETRQPVDQEKKVLAALGRRNSYPVREAKDEEGEVHKYREIMFRGSVDEAVEMLGSKSEGTSTLAARFLRYKADVALPVVVAAIDKQMFQFAEPQNKQFRHLRLLMKLLGTMSDEKVQPELEKLITKYVAYIRGGSPEPMASKPEYWSVLPEEIKDNANHALAWLLMQLDEDVVLRNYGETLLKLRDTAKGNWKKEIQLALDGSRVEDNMELAAVFSRMTDTLVLRTKQCMIHSGCAGIDQVAFSNDGTLLATAGHGGEIRLWNTNDWSLNKTILQDGSINKLIFSPNGKHLYVAGCGVVRKIHARYDVATGKLDKKYEGRGSSISYMWLAKDGKTMVTFDYLGDAAHIWDTESGEILKSLELLGECRYLTVSPDGKILAYQAGEGEITIEAFSGEQIPKHTIRIKENAYIHRIKITFSRDGKYLAVAQGRFALIREVIDLALFDVTGNFKLVAEREIEARWATSLTISPDCQSLLLGTERAKVFVFSLPKLKQAHKLTWPDPASVYEVESIDFCPDNNLLAVGCGHATAHLLHTGSFKEIRPYEGHGGRIKAIYFFEDGRKIRTLGYDNTVCIWDANTLRLLKRFALPKETMVMGTRKSDGKYIVCYDLSNPAQIVDTDTGEVISRVKLPRGRIHWRDEHRAIVTHEHGLVTFDYIQGQILKEVNMEYDIKLLYRLRYMMEDGNTLFFYQTSGGKFVRDTIAVQTMDVDRGNYSEKVEAKQRICGGYNKGGLVPVGAYFYIADPGMYIFSRKTAKLITYKAFKNTDLLSITFDSDGKRYAVVTGGRIFVRDLFNHYDPGIQSIARIHDTQSGKTLFAFPTSTRWVSVIRFSPDGRYLALANDDGTLELRQLPRAER